METCLTRARALALLAAVMLPFAGGPARADGRCDLNTLVGYTLVFAKPVDGYIEGGRRKKGYEGCQLDRVLVFADNTGVRCKEVVHQHLDAVPTAYLFGRSQSDLRLCVAGYLFEVSPTN